MLTATPRDALAAMRNYGALFLGEGTCVSYGDKVIGTNHVLPTRGAARYTGGLWVGKYLKTVTYQEVRDPAASALLGEVCGRAARVELFEGHARSGDIRAAKVRGTRPAWLAESRWTTVDGQTRRPRRSRPRRRARRADGAGHRRGQRLGRAIALALAGAGARVILAGRTKATLDETAGAAPPASGATAASVAPADVAEPGVGRRAAGLAGRRARSTSWSTTPGIGGPVKPLVDIAPAEWDEVFGANVRSIYLMCRAFLPAMYRRGSGDVINIASVTGKRPLTRRTPYAASKMAVLGLTRTLAFEAGPLRRPGQQPVARPLPRASG